MSYKYMAIAYTGVEAKSNEIVTACAVQLIRAEIPLYSPITHWHFVAQFYELPTEYRAWAVQALAMVEACNDLRVIVPVGWEQRTIHSKGVRAEVAHAQGLGKPIEVSLYQDGDMSTHPSEALLIEQLLDPGEAPRA